VFDDDEPLGIRVRQRLEENPVDAGEHGGAGSGAERQRQEGGDGEAGAVKSPHRPPQLTGHLAVVDAVRAP
jgi:hypothetical protein